VRWGFRGFRVLVFLLFSLSIRQDRLRGLRSIEKMNVIAGVVSKKLDSNAYVTQAEAGRDSMNDNVTAVPCEGFHPQSLIRH
jgi:hypothetical protein